MPPAVVRDDAVNGGLPNDEFSDRAGRPLPNRDLGHAYVSGGARGNRVACMCLTGCSAAGYGLRPDRECGHDGPMIAFNGKGGSALAR